MRRRGPALFCLAVWLPYFVWWLALYPGGLGIDSFEVWKQITLGPWDNHHPAPYVATVWLTSWGGHSIAAATLAQTVAVALSVAYLAWTVRATWGGGRAVLVAAVALGWLPLIAPFAVILQKDVWELAALVVLAAELVRVAALPGGSRPSRLHLGSMFVAALLATVWRWNGVATVLVAAAVMVVGAARGRRRLVVSTLAGAAVIGFGVLLAIPRVLPVAPVRQGDTHFEMVADLGTYAADEPSLFTAADRAALDRVAPFGAWQEFGRQGCDSVNYVIFRLLGHRHLYDRMVANVPQLSATWHRLVHRSPWTMLRARLCRSALAWSPVALNLRPMTTVWPLLAARTPGQSADDPATVVRNRFGMAAHPVNAQLGAVARSWARPSADNVVVQSLLWRPIVWLLALATALLVWPRREGRWSGTAAALAVPLGVCLSFAVAPAAQEARYTYPAVVICQLLLVAAAATRRRPAATAD